MTTLALRLALAALLLAYTWHAFGPLGAVFASVIAAVMLARPIVDALFDAPRALAALALCEVEGRAYAFRGVPIAVSEDDAGARYVSIATVRRVVPTLARDAVLHRLLPSGLVTSPSHETSGLLSSRDTYARVDELADLFVKSQDADTIRFKNWLRREVDYPSEAARRAGRTPTSPIKAGADEPAS